MPSEHVVDVQTMTAMSIQDLVVAFLRAVERFRAEDSRASRDDEQLQVLSRGRAALAEALSWADSIDQYLRAGPRDTPRDPAWADTLEPADAQLVAGFQRARNVVHHRWWDAVSLRMHVTDAGHINHWIWGALPEPSRNDTGRGRDRTGDAAYHSALHGRSVLHTLDALARIFFSRRGWEISVADLQQPGCTIGTPLTLDPERS